MARTSFATLIVLTGALALGACASDGGLRPRLTASPSLGADTRTPTQQVLDLLNEGRRDKARAVLQTMLAKNPQDATARKLIDQIDRDPKAILGSNTESYRVREGETMSMLAGRFLGDPLLFYALTRYNGMAAPTLLQPGQVILIPRRAKPAVTAAPRPAKRAASRPKTAPTPQAETRDVAGAARLRTTALDHLNRGSVDQAVTLLRRAAELNPDDGLIKRDLQRALRLQATVKARS